MKLYFGLRSYTDTCRICLDIKANGLDPATVLVDYDKHVQRSHHYAGQIGSEATPAEWVAALVACTAEWVRVLKPSGSLFVNLGDSYASQPAGKPGKNSQVNGKNPAEAHAARRGERQRRPNGDRQFTREDAAWLAGVIDSDGSISVHINQQAEGRAPSFVSWVRVAQMRPEVVTRIAELVGTGKVMQDTRGVWNWTAAAQQARWVLERIHPWLLIKKRQAWAAIEVARHVEDRNAKGSWRQLTADDIAYRQRLRDAVLAWNKGRPDDMPVPEPQPVALPIYPLAPRAKSLYDLPHQYAAECVGRLGLIKRAEICWSKPNGLPESVQDRVRRSHEFVFHFTRQPRYYSAVDEIREAHAPQSIARSGRKYNAGDLFSVGTPNTLDPAQFCNPLGKLPGSVWNIPSQPLTVPASLGVDHFAAFPMELPRRCVLGWSPPGVCTACGEGRRPVVVTDAAKVNGWALGQIGGRSWHGDGTDPKRALGVAAADRNRAITGYACACPQPTAPTRPAVVLDPFCGTGTTMLVASAYGRIGIGVDRSADYCRLAKWRTADPGERARALEVPKPPKQLDGQGELFEELMG